MEGKTAEAADLDALAMGQGTTHHFQQRFHCEIDVVCLQVSLATAEDFDEF